MKKAKVSKGVVHHVWPWVKTLPDGSQVVKELPPQYRGLNGKPIPDCIVDVPDEVQPKWRWNGEAYVPPPSREEKIKNKQPISRDWFAELLAEKLGIPYEELLKEAKQRKIDALAKKD